MLLDMGNKNSLSPSWALFLLFRQGLQTSQMKLLLLLSMCYRFSMLEGTHTKQTCCQHDRSKHKANADRTVQTTSIKCFRETHLLHTYRNKSQPKQKSGVELSTARPTANLPSSNGFESQDARKRSCWAKHSISHKPTWNYISLMNDSVNK